MTVRIKSKFRFALFTTVLLTIVISILSVFLPGSRAQVIPDHYLSWNVKKGDTLWTIAKNYLPSGRDIRDYIIEIRKWNGLDSYNIIEGQLLQIPIYDESSRIDHTSEVFGMNE
ncbi:MAG: LysM peptidoglycan-binding domain-containing protein [Caldicoprobacterales bacterium]|nr:LysM peptidoglycan-binding domain-containing protein [Clostridiales bacterium]